ncbi:MAG: CHASE3 domain-containing protein [Methylococcaceae bacterium]|nr:CHASE3 domain-containing protein [Methylococcaceae bacterium]
MRSAISGEFLTSSALWTLVLIFCCLLLTTFIAYRSTSELIEDNAWVLHTQEVLEQILEISTNVRTAEGRQRGFLLTQDNKYLDNYQETIREINSHLQALKQLVADNPARKIEVQELQKLIEQRIFIMGEVLDTYKNEGVEQGKQKLIHGGGLTVMRQITVLTDKIKSEEKQLLKKRSLRSNQSRDFALRGLVIGAIFTTTLVFFSYYLLVIDLRRRQQNEKALANARDNLEEKIQERTQELEQSNRELQEFAYIASHDLQEPLRKIQIFGDRLKLKAADQLDDSALDYLGRMQSSAKRMQNLINDLLQFSRISANTNAEGFLQVDLNLVLQDVLSDLEGSLEHYGGVVAVDHLPTIKANPLQIRQLLQNMLSNALKFHCPGVPPEVNVHWHNQTKFSDIENAEKYYEITISDNGIGIDQQYADKIFVPFQRLHGKNEYDGTGIGLAICRKIIEKHHGYIHVLPAPTGHGTRFVLCFPAF